MINNLDHENVSVKNAAIENLSHISNEYTILSLMQVANNNSNTVEKRINAIKVLGKIGNNRVSQLLINISLDEGEEKTVRMTSILALGEIGNETTVRNLENLSSGDDGLILYHAAYVLDQMEDGENVYASYGKLPYPLSEEQRLYRNNVTEIQKVVDEDFPVIENATTMCNGYNIKSGYIEIASDIEPESFEMDNIYKTYDEQARKRGIYQVPVRFVRCGTASPLEGYWYNISDFETIITHVYTLSDDDDDVKSQVFVPEFKLKNTSN